MKVIVTYDARPILIDTTQYRCAVRKYTKTGMFLYCIDDDPIKAAKFNRHYGDVLFKNDGTAKGWETLTWVEERLAKAESEAAR